MTISTAYNQLLYQLFELYDDREAANIADWVIEFITGQKRIDRLIYKNIPLNEAQIKQLHLFIDKLLQNQPVQYVLNEAWFAAMKFYVDDNVLIPRPETEELVELVASNSKIKHQKSKILDIGTGSGCIPIALKKKLPNAEITSIDVSEKALEIATKNAKDLRTAINLRQVDFLDNNTWESLGKFDIIVSNPPYIKQSESVNMSKHVTSYEPNIALFVADDDALIFYKKIAEFGKQHLTENGQIFVEINEVLGNETIALLESFGYKALLKKDLQGKDRMAQSCL